LSRTSISVSVHQHGIFKSISPEVEGSVLSLFGPKCDRTNGPIFISYRREDSWGGARGARYGTQAEHENSRSKTLSPALRRQAWMGDCDEISAE
jgi:hypothetical protein